MAISAWKPKDKDPYRRILRALYHRGSEGIARTGIGHLFTKTSKEVAELLEDLQSRGLIVGKRVVYGRGRPLEIWHLTPKGKDLCKQM